MRRSILAAVCTAAFLWGAAGCRTTELVEVTGPAHAVGPISSALVLGPVGDPAAREGFERELVRRLAARGVAARASVDVLGPEAAPSLEDAGALARSHGLDAVLATRVAGEVFRESVVREAPLRDSGLHGGLWDDPFDPTDDLAVRERVVTFRFLELETVLRDARSDAVLWSAVSETFEPGSADEVTDELTGLVIRGLAEAGLLP